MRKRILVTYKLPEDWMGDLFENFRVILPEKQRFSEWEIIKKAEEVDGIFTIFGIPVPEEAMGKNNRLKIISNYGVGVDHIPVDFATGHGILVTNTPDAVTEATAELTLGLMLASVRRIAECDRKIRKNEIKWGVEENLGMTLTGKTLGIVGLGKIGRSVAGRAFAMGMKIIYFNRNPLSVEEEMKFHASYVSLSELMLEADVVSLHIPLNRDTRHLIGLNELSLMKPTAYLINTARGPVLDEAALISVLEDGLISGAGLDVYELEPNIPKEFLAMDQVVLMPHSGTATLETRKEIARMAIQNLIDYFKGNHPGNMVNPEVLPHHSS